MRRYARRTLRLYLPLLCALLALYPAFGPIADAGYAERLPWHGHVERIGEHLHAYDLAGQTDADSANVGATPGDGHGAAGVGGLAWALTAAVLITALGLLALIRGRPERLPHASLLSRDPRPPCAWAAA
ncbi:MAG: hypothetical protein OXI25_07555 [Chloroflexota bacterium]|nr:hypothetical protein [Chloroflexota bacterium]